jgi:hypothetical protein
MAVAPGAKAFSSLVDLLGQVRLPDVAREQISGSSAHVLGALQRAEIGGVI